MLLWLQNQVETGEPSGKIVKQCLAYFAKSAPADAVAAMARLEGVVPQLSNNWATAQSASGYFQFSIIMRSLD